MRDAIKTRRLIDELLEDLPATNDVLTFTDSDRIIHVSLCECDKCSVINITIKRIEHENNT